MKRRATAIFSIILMLICSIRTGFAGDAADIVGKWHLSSFIHEGTTYKAKEFEIAMTLDCKSDGSVEAITKNSDSTQSSKGTWEKEGSKYAITDDDGDTEYVIISNGKFTIESEGTTFIFERETTEKPELFSVKFSNEKATIKQDVTITAVTSTNAAKLIMYAGGKTVKTWTEGFTDKDGKRTWKVTYAFAGAGERTLDFKAGDANGALTAAKTAKITVIKAQPLALNSVGFSSKKAAVNEKITITAVTSTNAAKLIMYTGGKKVKTWTKGYTDKDGKRTWKITYAFSGAGERTLDFKAGDANGKLTAAKTAKITIAKAQSLTLSSVKFSKATAKVKEKVTITAVTSTNAAKLTMYTGGKAVKSWTAGYTEKDGKRTWKITYAFSGAGKRTLVFKAFDASGKPSAEKTASIEITK